MLPFPFIRKQIIREICPKNIHSLHLEYLSFLGTKPKSGNYSANAFFTSEWLSAFLIIPRCKRKSMYKQIYHYLPKSAIICHYLPKSAIICQKVPECVKCPLPVWYICTVTCQRRSPFGSRSMFDRFPLVLRYFFVRPSFVLRSVSVREARCNGDVTDKEKIRNKPEYKSQRSLKSIVARSNTEIIPQGVAMLSPCYALLGFAFGRRPFAQCELSTVQLGFFSLPILLFCVDCLVYSYLLYMNPISNSII